MCVTNLLDWKIARLKPLSPVELDLAFEVWELRIDYWIVTRIMAEEAGEDTTLATQRLDDLMPGLEHLFRERDRHRFLDLFLDFSDL